MRLSPSYSLSNKSTMGMITIVKIFFLFIMFLDLRSDISKIIHANQSLDDVENVRTHVIVREKGHYFGNCIVFDHPGMSPAGMDNKVRNVQVGMRNKNFIIYLHRCKLD